MVNKISWANQNINIKYTLCALTFILRSGDDTCSAEQRNTHSRQVASRLDNPINLGFVQSNTNIESAQDFEGAGVAQSV
jgi:hypothetical protein